MSIKLSHIQVKETNKILNNSFYTVMPVNKTYTNYVKGLFIQHETGNYQGSMRIL